MESNGIAENNYNTNVMNMTFSLPEIQISPNLYTAFKIIFFVGLFITIAFNILSVHASLPPNTTDWNWGGLELTDDNLSESEEEQDEQIHQDESDEFDDER